MEEEGGGARPGLHIEAFGASSQTRTSRHGALEAEGAGARLHSKALGGSPGRLHMKAWGQPLRPNPRDSLDSRGQA